MRSRIVAAAGLSVAALALSTLATGVASAADAAPTAVHKGSAAKVTGGDAKACFSNMTGDTFAALTSQNFEASFDQYDGEIADDWTVKKKCKVKSIDIVGAYWNGVGPGQSMTVTVYKDNGGVPGAVAKSWTGGSDTSGTGTYNVPAKGKIKKGTYWVGAVLNMDFAAGGQWGRENTTTSVGAAGLFKNPGNGFGTGCTDWADAQACFAGSAPGTDYMMQVNGKGK